MKVHFADNLEFLRTLADDSIDAIVTDPPYGLSFMGKAWDHDVPTVELWRECLRVLKPGGHLLAFAGTRTQHRMAVNIEDAGFDIRDMIAWVYGSGFPKSLDVSKAIDKGHGENRARQLRFVEWMRSTGITAKQIKEATGTDMASRYLTNGSQPQIATADLFDKMRPYLPEVPEEIERLVAERTGIEWTAYKNREVVGRDTKARSTTGLALPRMGASVEYKSCDITAPATDEAKRWNGWGTALKPALEPITVARKPLIGTVAENVLRHGTGAINIDGCRVGEEGRIFRLGNNGKQSHNGEGFECGGDVAGVQDFDWQGVGMEKPPEGRFPANLIHDGSDEVTELLGSASRFFYCAKASKRDRDEGLTESTNRHPTVKPTDLMRYLVRLVTPTGGTVLDPFAGSGSTGKACALEGFDFIGIEREAEYCEIANARIDHAIKTRGLF